MTKDKELEKPKSETALDPREFAHIPFGREFLMILASQTASASVSSPHCDEEVRQQHHRAAIDGLRGIAPQDELEGMLASQLIACHSASLECYRRAMLNVHPLRDANLNQANKLSRTFVSLLEALNKHRGKSSQQKVTVEHVHVHPGGQAIVGHAEQKREGGGTDNDGSTPCS